MVKLNQELETKRGVFSEWRVDYANADSEYFYTVEMAGSGYIDIYLDEMLALNQLVSLDTTGRVESFSNPRLTDEDEIIWEDFCAKVQKYGTNNLKKCVSYIYNKYNIEGVVDTPVTVSDYDEQEGLYYITSEDGTILAVYDPDTGMTDYSSDLARNSKAVKDAIDNLRR